MTAGQQVSGFGTMSSSLPDAVRYHGWIVDLLRPHLGRTVLEIGVGYGQYTRVLAPLVDRLTGVDIDPQCLTQPLPPNVRPVLADLASDDFAARVGEGVHDTAVCLNVLEHVDDDLLALRSLRAALGRRGRLLLLVPAHPALYGAMDRLAGHFRRYTRRLLRQRLEEAGFRIVALRHINPLGGLGWWANARFGRPQTLSDPAINRQILLFDRYVQPLSRWLTPLTGRWFGQSLWAVAERREEE